MINVSNIFIKQNNHGVSLLSYQNFGQLKITHFLLIVHQTVTNTHQKMTITHHRVHIGHQKMTIAHQKMTITHQKMTIAHYKSGCVFLYIEWQTAILYLNYNQELHWYQ